MQTTTSGRALLPFLLSLVLATSVASAQGTRTISLRTSNGNTYLTAPNGGGSDLFANKYEPKAWETFTLEDINGGKLLNWDQICLRTHAGHYVVAENGGGREARADRTECGPWEIFRIAQLTGPAGYPMGGNAELPSYRGFSGSLHVAFLTMNGHWLVAENGGGGAVNVNRGGIGPWERFQVFGH